MISQKNLHIITQTDLGGAQKYVLGQALKDKTNAIETLIVSMDDFGWLYQQAKLNNIPYKVIHSLNRSINPIKDIAATFEIIKLLKQQQPTHIFLNSSKIGFIGSLAAKICGIKNIIYTVHGWVFNEPMPSWQKKFYLLIEKLSARWKTKLLFINNYDLEIAKKLGIGRTDQYELINLEIEKIEFVNKITAQQKLFSGIKINYQEKKIIGTIANTYPTKNLSALIDIANELKDFSQLLFVVIGDGPETIKLQQKINALKLQNIYFLGQITDASKYLKAFDLFILTSVKEGSPYVLLEAQQANIPILATHVGGVPEMLPANQLCRPEEFVQRIKTLFGIN